MQRSSSAPRRTRLALLGLLLLAAGWLATVTHTSAAPPAGGPAINLVEVASGFDQPVDITHAGDSRLFVVEQTGQIRILMPDGTILPTPFLDLSVCSDGEAGLLGLVFHPDYATNGHFFVNYTVPTGADCSAITTHISRFTVSAADPNVADPASEVILLSLDQPYNNHNAGDLAFGPDGYLYVPLGDGGSGGDPQDRAQDGGTLFGKLLRIAPSTDATPTSPYTIPADNPFVGDPTVLDEIWALGLRNPWRISFDRLTGDLYIGDVGQSAREEIDFQPASSTGGENYGWRCYEGSEPYNLTGCPPASAFVFPVAEYDRMQGIAVTGGFVYRGAASPSLQGYYFFADFGFGRLWSLRETPTGWEMNEVAQPGFNISTFGEDAAGELYLAQHDLGNPTGGTIYRLEGATPTAVSLGALGTGRAPVALGGGTVALAALALGLARARRRR